MASLGEALAAAPHQAGIGRAAAAEVPPAAAVWDVPEAPLAVRPGLQADRQALQAAHQEARPAGEALAAAEAVRPAAAAWDAVDTPFTRGYCKVKICNTLFSQRKGVG